MDIVELFNRPEMELPKKRPIDDFEAYIAGIFGDYMALLSSLDEKDILSRQVKSAAADVSALCQKIQESLSEYLKGVPSKSLRLLEEGIEGVELHLSGLYTPRFSPESEDGINPHLYRMRRGAMERFTKGNLFHIPFDKRHTVARQRYSIPGLPCLYLGGSVWACWEELGRPPLNEMHVSRFKRKTSVKLLDFGRRPALIAAMIAKNRQVSQDDTIADFVLSQAVCWPLMAACSIRVLDSEAAFAPEYILPQQMLQWLMLHAEDYDGIRYFSTAITQYPDDPVLSANYVFPVRSKMPEGYCHKLAADFNLTDPVLWPIILGCLGSYQQGPGRPAIVKFIPTTEIPYEMTDFGDVEGVLQGLPESDLSA